MFAEWRVNEYDPERAWWCTAASNRFHHFRCRYKNFLSCRQEVKSRLCRTQRRYFSGVNSFLAVLTRWPIKHRITLVQYHPLMYITAFRVCSHYCFLISKIIFEYDELSLIFILSLKKICSIAIKKYTIKYLTKCIHVTVNKLWLLF